MQLLPDEHGFDQPLELLSDCHRRIERFLQMLGIVSKEAPEEWLPTQHERGLQLALDYFRDAAPRHTEDEEESIFPRLRNLKEASVIIERLESEHKVAEQLHSFVETLGRAWLAEGTLSQAERDSFARAVDRLDELYQEHIKLEDSELFPLASSYLDPYTLSDIGNEMASRRGISL